MFRTAACAIVQGMDLEEAGTVPAGHPHTPGRYGRSLLVAFGWYATVAAALVVATSSVPEAPERDCAQMFGCLSATQKLTLLGVFIGVPVAAVLSVVTLVVTVPLARRIPSAVLAGTLSALVSAATTGGLVRGYLGA